VVDAYRKSTSARTDFLVQNIRCQGHKPLESVSACPFNVIALYRHSLDGASMVLTTCVASY